MTLIVLNPVPFVTLVMRLIMAIVKAGSQVVCVVLDIPDPF